ncbi:MAG: carboxypeptidase regulatory-like domain-containing protein [Nitrospirae bacterium]|nr:carboxypeptidase regulatory-like domain-containing protein [Nitrospirota bacterium]
MFIFRFVIQLFLCLFFIVCLNVFGKNKAFATHETDHRFTVYGTVKDSSGAPQPNVKVMISDTVTGEGNTVFTDQKGHYEVLLHLHNNNLGDEIRIMAGKEIKTIKALFNPEDKKTERKTAVDVEMVEFRGAKQGYGWSVAAGILFVMGFLFLLKRLFQQRKMLK